MGTQYLQGRDPSGGSQAAGPECGVTTWHWCHLCHCMAPGVIAVPIPAWSLGCSTGSLSLHSPWGVTVSPWLPSPARVTQRCCTAPRHRSVTVARRGVSHGVTVTVRHTGVSLSLRGHRSSCELSPRVTVRAWRMGCHTVPCHCMAHGLSPTVTITAWPGVSHAVTVQDPPQCHPLHLPQAVTRCHCAPRPWGTLGTALQVPAAPAPAAPTPCPLEPSPDPVPGERPLPIPPQPGSR